MDASHSCNYLWECKDYYPHLLGLALSACTCYRFTQYFLAPSLYLGTDKTFYDKIFRQLGKNKHLESISAKVLCLLAENLALADSYLSTLLFIIYYSSWLFIIIHYYYLLYIYYYLLLFIIIYYSLLFFIIIYYYLFIIVMVCVWRVKYQIEFSFHF